MNIFTIKTLEKEETVQWEEERQEENRGKDGQSK
jgi:hypothetical protein